MKILILLLVFASPAVGCPQDPATVTTVESVIRKAAIKSVMPKYPSSSRKRGANGVAVADVEIDEDGEIAMVKIVESPDRETGRAVEKAIRQWKFTQLKAQGKPVRVLSKLTFYFVIQKGKGRVENPRRYQ